MEKKQILFICSLTGEDNPLRIIDEIGAIEPLLLSSEWREEYFFTPKISVHAGNLTKTILNSNAGVAPFILHFSLHGNEKKGLKFAKLNSDPVFQSVAYFEDILKEITLFRKQELKCLVFNCCHTAALAQIASQFAGCTIGIEGVVDDLAAVEFSRGFYQQLLDSEAEDEELFQDCFRMGQLYIKQWMRDDGIKILDTGPSFEERYQFYNTNP